MKQPLEVTTAWALWLTAAFWLACLVCWMLVAVMILRMDMPMIGLAGVVVGILLASSKVRFEVLRAVRRAARR